MRADSLGCSTPRTRLHEPFCPRCRPSAPLQEFAAQGLLAQQAAAPPPAASNGDQLPLPLPLGLAEDGVGSEPSNGSGLGSYGGSSRSGSASVASRAADSPSWAAAAQ